MAANERDKRLHNRGEKDAAKGRYNPPHGIFDDLTTWTASGMKRNGEENEAYNKGYRNAKKQRGK
jgi:hypothetical protein